MPRRSPPSWPRCSPIATCCAPEVAGRATVTCARASNYGVERGALERVRRAQRSFQQLIGGGASASPSSDSAAVLLAMAYPDRVGRRRAGSEGRYLLANGRGAMFE